MTKRIMRKLSLRFSKITSASYLQFAATKRRILPFARSIRSFNVEAFGGIANTS